MRKTGDEFGLFNFREIYGKSQQSRIVAARWKAAARMRDQLQMNTTEIGLAVRRDHSTVVKMLKYYYPQPEPTPPTPIPYPDYSGEWAI